MSSLPGNQHDGNPAGELDTRLRIAAIRFLNPAPLMWDFEHPPLNAELAARYQIEWMMPAQCAERLALPADHPDAADIGLVPIAALATTPGLRIIPGCAIASKQKVRSILLIRRESTELSAIRTVAADTSSRASLAYTQIMSRGWSDSPVKFVQHAPDLDAMLAMADAALVIGDPALFALEDAAAREQRSGEKLIYLDLAEEWIATHHVPWVSAVWAIRETSIVSKRRTLESIAADLTASRDHGLANIERLVEEWRVKLSLPEQTIREYMSSNIFYKLDAECLTGLRTFYSMAARYNVLPPHNFDLTNH